jgi:hypothetical protein
MVTYMQMKTIDRHSIQLLVVIGSSIISTATWAQSNSAGADDLAKKLANPIAALISVPFEYTWETKAGSNEQGEKNYLTLKPVVPISINQEWNLISRTVMPLVKQTDITPGTSQSGIGDVTQSFFFSPKAPTSDGLIWGVGPIISIPSNETGLSSKQWGTGPTGVVLKQSGTYTFGMLAFNLYGLGQADAGMPKLNNLFLQPFVTKQLGQGLSISSNLESSYDWTGQQWTVPLNLSVAQVMKIGDQPVSFSLGARYFVEKSDMAPHWGIRAAATFLFPK